MARIASAPRRQPYGMNKTETRYAQELELRKRVGEVHEWWFEPVSLRIGRNCFYRPDFMVQLADGSLELHEVKGHWEDDARVKVRAVAAMYPFRLIAVQRKGGGWKVEELSA